MLSNYISSKTNVNTNLLPWNLVEPIPTDPYILGKILAFPKATRDALNLFVTLGYKHIHLYASQIKMAKRLGISARHFRRIVKQLCELGLIAKHWAGYNKPCWYKLSTWFSDEHIKYSLSKILPFFYYSLKLTATLLLSTLPIDDVLRSINDLGSKYISKSLSYLSPTLEKTETPIKKESMYPLKKQIDNKPQGGEQKYNKPFLPSSLNPFAHKSFDDNMQRWNEYESSPDVRNYISHFGDKGINKQRNVFMEKLYNQHKGSLVVDVVEPEIKLRSITVDAERLPHTLSQEIKKDEASKIVIDVKDENTTQIKEWLSNINWDEEDSEPNYDPSLEEEELDLPLQL